MNQANFVYFMSPIGPGSTGNERTTSVGSYQPNAFRLYDMHGNVQQWCQDWYDANYYRNSPSQDPQGPKEELAFRVVRGGGWKNYSQALRSASRSSLEPGSQNNFTGFRVVAVQSGLANKPEPPTLDPKPPEITPPASITKPAEGIKQITNSIGMKLVLIPAGKFMMGSPASESGRKPLPAHNSDEEQHEVEITQPFYMGMYAVTQEEYKRVMGNNPSYFSATGDGKAQVQGMDTSRFPVEQVSWDDAVEFCRKLSEMSQEKTGGVVYRLPTEAQWEYACRAGTTTAFNVGNSLSVEQANIDDGVWQGRGGSSQFVEGKLSLKRTTAVGSYQPNAFGLYDMHGNVLQWCQDWYSEKPLGGKDPVVTTEDSDPGRGRTIGLLDADGKLVATIAGSRRVARGGFYNRPGSDCRSASRYMYFPGDWHAFQQPGRIFGLRVVAVQSGR